MTGNKNRKHFLFDTREFLGEETAQNCEALIPEEEMLLTLRKQKEHLCIALQAELFPDGEALVPDSKQLKLAGLDGDNGGFC